MRTATLLLALAACCAPACAQTLKVWVHSGPGPERDAYVASVKAFNDAQGRHAGAVRAELVPLPEADYDKAVQRAAKERKLPCVLEFDGPNLAAYASAGHLLPIDELPRMARIRDSMLASLVRQGTVDGRLYSVGQYDSGLALWVNRELLSQVNARIPTRANDGWTLQEFEEILKRLKQAGVAYPLDMKFNYGVGEWFTYGFAPLVQGFGGDLIERVRRRRSTGYMNGPDAVAALKTLQSWVKAGYVDAAPKDDNDFVSGRSAISWVGHWVYGDYKKALGDKLGLVPLPRFATRTVTGSGSWNFGIAASCPHREAAGRFLEHLMSREEILRVTQVNGAVPGTGAAMIFSSHYSPKGELRLFAEQLLAGMARVRPSTPHYPVISRNFAEAVSQIAKGADVQQTLDRAARTIDETIAADAVASPARKTP